MDPIASQDSVQAFFADLDSGISAFLSDHSDQPYAYRATDLVVQQTFSLPIPCLAGSLIKYAFSTKIGDISFRTSFLPASHGSYNSRHSTNTTSNSTSTTNSTHPNATVVSDSGRLPSDQETIYGSYRALTDGTFVLEFDNSFSWFNPKLLTYNVELFQPAFSLADRSRCMRSASLLHCTIEDSRRAELRLAKVMERLKALKYEVPVLEERFAALQSELILKRTQLTHATEEAAEMKTRIDNNYNKKMGLCIRCLNKPLLTHVLSFLGPQSEAAAVCKYWRLLCTNNSNNNNNNDSK